MVTSKPQAICLRQKPCAFAGRGSDTEFVISPVGTGGLFTTKDGRKGDLTNSGVKYSRSMTVHVGQRSVMGNSAPCPSTEPKYGCTL